MFKKKEKALHLTLPCTVSFFKTYLAHHCFALEVEKKVTDFDYRVKTKLLHERCVIAVSADGTLSKQPQARLQLTVSTTVNRIVGLFFNPYSTTTVNDQWEIPMYAAFSLLEWGRSLRLADHHAKLHLPSSILLEVLNLDPTLEVCADARVFRSDRRTHQCGCRDRASCADVSN